MVRTTQDRCTNEQCNHVIVHPSRVVGRASAQDGPVTIYGASFVEEVRAVSPTPGQDGPARDTVYADQDGPAPLVPVSFVTTADAEAADRPRVHLVERHHDQESPPHCVFRGCTNVAENRFACADHLRRTSPGRDGHPQLHRTE